MITPQRLAEIEAALPDEPQPARAIHARVAIGSSASTRIVLHELARRGRAVSVLKKRGHLPVRYFARARAGASP